MYLTLILYRWLYPVTTEKNNYILFLPNYWLEAIFNTNDYMLLTLLLSVNKLCPTLCDPVDSSTPGCPVLHYLPECAQTHVHRVNYTIQPSHPPSCPSPPALNLSQHQGLFQWVSSWHQVAKILLLMLTKEKIKIKKIKN